MKKRPDTSNSDTAQAWFAFWRRPKLSVLAAVVVVLAFVLWVVPRPRHLPLYEQLDD